MPIYPDGKDVDDLIKFVRSGLSFLKSERGQLIIGTSLLIMLLGVVLGVRCLS